MDATAWDALWAHGADRVSDLMRARFGHLFNYMADPVTDVTFV